MTPNLPDSPPLLRTLDDWSSHCKRLHPSGIDLTLDTSLNLNQLVSDILAARRPPEDDGTAGPAVEPAR